ncbi:unnamed protein product [Caenorhabditis angaria]|uniref:Uncharacterized protein n=1 Tax=Caenorhabditis angaria TaxID=860376 RepID=A0A9P1N5P2_9PELO|nr:unnamed protein product [Caenorhabditis angaria]
MSVDQTITELSGTLAQLSSLVAHINGQISGITGRINLTLDNFDMAVANLAKDAGSVTYQVGETVSQVPNSWVFYLLFITLIVVFLLLSIVLLLNLVTKAHAIYSIMKSDDSSSQQMLMSPSSSVNKSDRSELFRRDIYAIGNGNGDKNRPRSSMRHVQIPMEAEPRRPGQRRETTSTISVEQSQNGQRPYQRRSDESVGGGKYNVDQRPQYTSSQLNV